MKISDEQYEALRSAHPGECAVCKVELDPPPKEEYEVMITEYKMAFPDFFFSCSKCVICCDDCYKSLF